MLYSRSRPYSADGFVPLLNRSYSYQRVRCHSSYVRQVHRRALASVVRVSVEVKNSLAFHRQDAADNALCQSGSENHNIVLFVLHRVIRMSIGTIVVAPRTL